MLLTKTQNGVSERAGAARPRLRRLAGATTPTMDRRAFLKRSGLVAGAGAFGFVRSRYSIRRSISARIAPRARRCASTACTKTRIG